MTTTHARIRTKSAMNHLRKFMDDWKNRTASFTDGKNSAVVILPLGRCEFEARDGFLDVTITADSIVHNGLLEDFVSNHLDLLSPKERLQCPWVLLRTATEEGSEWRKGP
jgi:hypothetical protein